MSTVLVGWQVWAVLAAGFAALTAIFGKLGVDDIDSNFATLIRTALVLGMIALLVAGTGSYQSLTTISRKTWTYLVLSGCATGGSWLCYYRALKLGPAAGVASLDKLSVLFVAILSVIFLNEGLLARNWLGLAMIAGGAALVASR